MSSSRVFVGFMAILLLISGLSSRYPQETGDIFFEQDGVWVRGEFADFYHAAPNPQRLFGNAISDAMEDPQRPGIQIQYFERMRMDLDPTRPAGERISLAKLGEYLRDETLLRDALDFSTNTSMCRAFRSGHLVCYAFLQFYDSYQGATYLGEPISDTEAEDGLLVQYFEYARMEWRADRPIGQRVVISEFGRTDFIRRIGPKSSFVNRNISELTVHAFVAKPVVVEGDEQQLFFVVYDQQGRAVPDASIMYTVTYSDGRVNSSRVEALTNVDGYTSAKFMVSGVKPNDVVNISATASLDAGWKATGVTWFRVWW